MSFVRLCPPEFSGRGIKNLSLGALLDAQRDTCWSPLRIMSRATNLLLIVWSDTGISCTADGMMVRLYSDDSRLRVVEEIIGAMGSTQRRDHCYVFMTDFITTTLSLL
jgi:hypothetical protein